MLGGLFGLGFILNIVYLNAKDGDFRPVLIFGVIFLISKVQLFFI